jgi:hypothetical protein
MSRKYMCSIVLAIATIVGSPQAATKEFATAAKPPLGETKAAAIEVCKPPGERAYLSRLVCPNGASPDFSRVGSFGERNPLPSNMQQSDIAALLEQMLSDSPSAPDGPDYHVVDGYELVCGTEKKLVYLDMYHCQSSPPTDAPLGFTIKPAEQQH